MPETDETAICDALTALLRGRTEWDESPGLYFLYRGEGGSMLLSPDSAIPAHAWDERPPETLAAFAGSLERLPSGMLAAVAPQDLIGAVFRFEGWGVTEPTDSPARARTRRLQRSRLLHLHPGRQEERCAWAVTRDGTNYMAREVRGVPGIKAEKVDGEISGLIPSSLKRMIRAMSAGVN